MLTGLVSLLMWGIPIVILLGIVFYVLSLRRIVPTNVVHIVQRGTDTVSYGVGKDNGNVYYEFPSWLPKIGVEVRELPVSNFDIDLESYSAYDKDRVPFLVDVKAFFHIADTNKAAEKVANFEELREQLRDIVRGVVRSILAKSPLEEIMEERPKYAKQFTDAVESDLANWGVESVKSIELMDVRDEPPSQVIHQIMAKKMSGIEKESREEVALNNQQAEQAELEARQKVAVTKADTDKISGEAEARSRQAIGIADAEAKKQSGIADQESESEIAKAEQDTAEEKMKVVRVNQLRQAEIDKEAAIVRAEEDKRKVEISAEADKFKVETDATAKLEAARREADGTRSVGTAEAEVIQAKGEAEAEAEKQSQLASVTAQTTLAKEIGENKPYQDYLIRVKEVEVSEVVGVAQYESIAEALSKADLKLLVNSGDVNSGINNLSDIFSSKGASNINGLVESLKQTEEGQALMDMLMSKMNVKLPETPNNPLAGGEGQA